MEIKDGERGDFNYDLKIEGGDVILSVSLDTKGIDGKIEIKLEGDYFLDKLAEAIPGSIDDMIIAALKGAMK